jgi:hypothetical protein
MLSVQIIRPDEAASAKVCESGSFCFSTGALTVAGQHTFVAEWSEHRMGLPLVNERSPAACITVVPGPPVDTEVRVACASIHAGWSQSCITGAELCCKRSVYTMCMQVPMHGRPATRLLTAGVTQQ